MSEPTVSRLATNVHESQVPQQDLTVAAAAWRGFKFGYWVMAILIVPLVVLGTGASLYHDLSKGRGPHSLLEWCRFLAEFAAGMAGLMVIMGFGGIVGSSLMALGAWRGRQPAVVAGQQDETRKPDDR